MKKKVILLTFILLLNLIFSTSGIAQEELVKLSDLRISNQEIETNKINTAEKLKNIDQMTTIKEESSKNIKNLDSHEIIRTQITVNTVKNTETIVENTKQNQEIKTSQKVEASAPKHKKPITLSNIFKIDNLNELCGYCGFSDQECESFKNYIIKNNLIYVHYE